MIVHLTPSLLIAAYQRGIFPMEERGRIAWYDPDPRTIFPLDAFHIPRRLAQRIRAGTYEIRVDTAFCDVMKACAAPARDRYSTWIGPQIIQAYTQLHGLGYAHSVESWQGDQLMGGLYGVSIKGLFAGESMFSRGTDASKVALVHLVERLRAGGYRLLDTQFTTPHLARFGAIEISRRDYQQRLAEAISVDATFYPPEF